MFKRFLKKRPAKKGKAKRRGKGRKKGQKSIRSMPTSSFRAPTYNSLSFKPWMTMLPQISRVTTKYEFQMNYTLAPGQAFAKQFRCNSIYDPEYTSGVGQASVGDFEKIAANYQRYRVLGSKISVRAGSGADGLISSGNHNFTMVVYPFYTAVSLVGGHTLAQAKLQRYAKSKMVQTYTGQRGSTITHKASTALMMGINPIEVQVNGQYASSMNGNPTSESYWNVLIANTASTLAAAATAETDFTLYVTIWYETELSQPFTISVPIGSISNDSGPTGEYSVAQSIQHFDIVGVTGTLAPNGATGPSAPFPCC